MMDLEQATRILELRPGATFRQVSEAREDLLALWNPDRMSDRPRLRAKVARKVAEINQAYDVLMEHLGQESVRRTTAPDRAPDPAPSVRAIEDSKQGPPSPEHSASLYEEVFSGRKQKKKRGIPVWPIAGGALLLVLGIVLYPSSSSEEVAGEPATAAAEELPSEPPATLPAGAAPEEEPDAATAEAVAAPEEAVEERPPEVKEVAVAPRREPPAPTPAPSPPAPARRAPRPQAGQSGASGQRPALKRQSATAQPTPAQPDGEKGASEEQERQRAEQFERVFRDLLANSTAARKLVDEGFADLRFTQWNVVSETDSEIWIELLAQKADGGSIHCTWAINPATGTTRALSAAARDLERSGQAN